MLLVRVWHRGLLQGLISGVLLWKNIPIAWFYLCAALLCSLVLYGLW